MYNGGAKGSGPNIVALGGLQAIMRSKHATDGYCSYGQTSWPPHAKADLLRFEAELVLLC